MSGPDPDVLLWWWDACDIEAKGPGEGNEDDDYRDAQALMREVRCD